MCILMDTIFDRNIADNNVGKSRGADAPYKCLVIGEKLTSERMSHRVQTVLRKDPGGATSVMEVCACDEGGGGGWLQAGMVLLLISLKVISQGF